MEVVAACWFRFKCSWLDPRIIHWHFRHAARKNTHSRGELSGCTRQSYIWGHGNRENSSRAQSAWPPVRSSGFERLTSCVGRNVEDPITCEKPDGSRQGGVLGCGLGLGRAPLFWVLGLGIFLGILIPPGIPVPVLFTESIQTFFIISVLPRSIDHSLERCANTARILGSVL